MKIDARELDSKELLLRLKNILGSRCEDKVDIEILMSSVSETKKVESFVSMSGCQSTVDKKEGYYIMRVWGNPCCS